MEAFGFALFGSGVFVGVMIFAMASAWDNRSGDQMDKIQWLADDNERC